MKRKCSAQGAVVMALTVLILLPVGALASAGAEQAGAQEGERAAESMLPEDFDPFSVEQPAWGEAVEGVQVRLQAGKKEAGPGIGGAETARWQSLGPYRADMAHLAVHPKRPDVVYGGARISRGMIVSRDGGLSWLGLSAFEKDTVVQINGVAVDPARPDLVYAATNGGVFGSSDGGVSWEPLNPVFAVTGPFVRCQGAAERFYASHEGGLYASDDRCRTWNLLKSGIVTSIGVDRTDQSRLFVGAGEGLFLTEDAGRTWSESLWDQQYPGSIRALVVSPAYPGLVYAGTAIYGRAHGDLYRSADGGRTWFKSPLLPEEEALQKSLQIRAIAATRDKPSTVVVGTTCGLFTMVDDGDRLHSQSPIRLAGRSVRDVAVTTDQDIMYAATDNGIYFSRDRGASWSVSLAGYPRANIHQLAVLPGRDGGVLAVQPGRLHILRKDGKWDVMRKGTHRVAIGGRTGKTVYSWDGHALARSDDLGRTWQPGGSPEPRFGAVDIAHSGGALYALEYEGALMRSNDDDASWQSLPLALPKEFGANAIHIDPVDSLRMYVGIRPAGLWHVGRSRMPSAGRISVPVEACRTLDGGQSWLAVPDQTTAVSLDAGYATLVAGSGAPGGVLYAATFLGFPVAVASVARSLDGGETWEAFGDQSHLHRVTALAVDPQDHRVAYAGNNRGHVFVSRDSGVTWAPLGGELDGGTIWDILVRPDGEDAVYAASGGGVFRLPLNP